MELAELTAAMETSENIVFFGGAGVSTESGVKDYRSEDGLYATVSQYGVSPETILSRSFFESRPDVFYDFYYQYFLRPDVKPNAAHYALARLEQEGRLKAVITQNVDGLHQKAGSRNVLELHGAALTHHCLLCGTPYSTRRVRALGGKTPYCDSCGGLVRPDIVLYGEPLDDRVCSRALRAISQADMLIVGGTSLAVYPAAGFLNAFEGRCLALINKSETPYDHKAHMVFRDSIGAVLSAAVKNLVK